MWEIVKGADGRWRIRYAGQEVGVLLASGDVRELSYGEYDEAVGAMVARTEFAAGELAAAARGARVRFEFEEDEETVDGRIITADATNFDRPAPLPIMCMTENPEWGHVGARLVGVVDTMGREGKTVWAEGWLDGAMPDGYGAEVERMIRDAVLTTWSPDMGNMAADIECAGLDEDGFCEKWILKVESCTLLACTIAPIPALTSARVTILEATVDGGTVDGGAGDPEVEVEASAEGMVASVSEMVIMASAGTIPVEPSPTWFEDPRFHAYTPETRVADEGRVYAYIAPWGECHIGMSGVCTVAPHSASGYAHFHLHDVVPEGCDCGGGVPTGTLTMGTGHADIRLSPEDARRHYDDTGTAVADIAVGEDAHGIYFSGALRPGVTREQVRELRGSSVSGDWRRIGGALEMVAVLVVNVPGFRSARPRVRVEDGVQTALVAAGWPHVQARDVDPEVNRRLADLERIARPLRRQAADALLQEIEPVKA